MKLFLGYFLAALLASDFSALAAGDIISPPSGGTSLFAQDIERSLELPGSTEWGDQARVKVDDAAFPEAIEIRTVRQPLVPWDYQIGNRIPGTIHKGDVIWLTVWMRALETSGESQEGLSQVSVEQASEPFDKLLNIDMDAGKAWRQFAWAFTADRDYAPGKTQLCFRAGYKPQRIQLGGIQMLDYGTSVSIADLPRSKISYPGMEDDAPWRKAAADRIERLRKADLKVIVTDTSGKPLAGATVKIHQQRHAFGFGSCVVARLIGKSGSDGDHYREIIKNDFSKVVMENDLKWKNWERGRDDGHETLLNALKWLHEQGISVRGHNLVWPSWVYSPDDLKALKDDKGALGKRIADHIRDEVGTLRGQVTEWDVVNEPWTNHGITDLLEPTAMTSWFELVHQIDPQPVLFLNDYAGLTNLGENTPHKDGFEKTLRELKDAGAPIGGLGIQCHFGEQLTGPEQLLRELDRWAALGLDIQITEFDINTTDEEIQRRYTRDFMTAVFSHPGVSAILTWGFWEGADWIPTAALYRKDWSIKPNGQAWNDLVLKQWHTDLSAQTDATGTLLTRGFMGQYEVTITYQGKETTWPLTLPKEGAVLDAAVPAGN